ncbi:MAG: hypothetical protein ACYCWC_10710 [Rhodocyclaceae bacterium]
MNAYPIRATVSQQLRSLDLLGRLLQKKRGNAAVPPAPTFERSLLQ